MDLFLQICSQTQIEINQIYTTAIGLCVITCKGFFILKNTNPMQISSYYLHIDVSVLLVDPHQLYCTYRFHLDFVTLFVLLFIQFCFSYKNLVIEDFFFFFYTCTIFLPIYWCSLLSHFFEFSIFFFFFYWLKWYCKKWNERFFIYNMTDCYQICRKT